MSNVKNKFKNLTHILDWQHLIQKCSATNCYLLLQNDDHFIFGWGKKDILLQSKGDYDEQEVSTFLTKWDGHYVFTSLSYDIKNHETQHLVAHEETGNPDLEFLVPEHVIIRSKNECSYFGTLPENEILAEFNTTTFNVVNESVSIKSDLSKSDYLDKIKTVKAHIQRGDIYEMNYCMNFNGAFDQLNPAALFAQLNAKASAPFSCYVRSYDLFIMSTSPERFLNLKGDRLCSQPIKGTAKRSDLPAEDEKIKQTLRQDQKERAENVMIVDLVRNDLSKVAQKNSVQVDELCGVYSFKTVHQLISTVSCNIKTGVDFAQILQALFPMGSMTGAPKISAMQFINELETFDRGYYSGSVGYFDPNGNFDLNVIIRTVIANLKKKQLNVSVGGAITIQSDPEAEYNECLLKLKAIQKTLC